MDHLTALVDVFSPRQDNLTHPLLAFSRSNSITSRSSPSNVENPLLPLVIIFAIFLHIPTLQCLIFGLMLMKLTQAPIQLHITLPSRPEDRIRVLYEQVHQEIVWQILSPNFICSAI